MGVFILEDIIRVENLIKSFGDVKAGIILTLLLRKESYLDILY